MNPAVRQLLFGGASSRLVDVIGNQGGRAFADARLQVSRAGSAYYFDRHGAMQTAAANTLREMCDFSAYDFAVEGDSITAGSFATSWASLMGLGFLTTISNTAVSGAKSADCRTRFDTYKGNGYTHFLLLCGVNDVANDVALATIQDNLTYMWSTAAGLGMTVVAMTVAPWKGFTAKWTQARQDATDQLNDWIRVQAGNNGYKLIDTYNLMEDPAAPDYLNPSYNHSDGLHWSLAGQTYIAGIVKEAVARPTLGYVFEDPRTNLLANFTTMATESVTTTAVAHTLTFWGTGTVTLSGTSTAGPLVGTAANDRVSLTFTPTAGTLTLTVTGTCSYGVLEVGSFATSPIAASSTRNADTVKMPSTGLFNPHEGTLLVEYSRFQNSDFGIVAEFKVAGPVNTGDTMVVAVTSSTDPRVQLLVNGSTTLDTTSSFGVQSANTNIKAAYAYKPGDLAAVRNGTTTVTSTTQFGAPTNYAQLNVGNSDNLVFGAQSGTYLNGYIKRLAYSRKRLSTPQLQALTA